MVVELARLPDNQVFYRPSFYRPFVITTAKAGALKNGHFDQQLTVIFHRDPGLNKTENLWLVTIKLDLAMSDHLNGVILLMTLGQSLTLSHHMKQSGWLNFPVTGHNLM
ncbi:hypothetical protein CBL_12352 [Carabus blaptoides fortunei]